MLPGKQTVSVAKSDNCEVFLYDSKLNRITDVTTSGDSVVTKNSCPAGTYYLRVRPSDLYEHTYIYPVATFSWK